MQLQEDRVFEEIITNKKRQGFCTWIIRKIPEGYFRNWPEPMNCRFKSKEMESHLKAFSLRMSREVYCLQTQIPRNHFFSQTGAFLLSKNEETLESKRKLRETGSGEQGRSGIERRGVEEGETMDGMHCMKEEYI